MDAGDLARAFAVCGRAGVDRDARVVIMTHRDTYDLYARRAKGSGETVASSYSVTEKIRSALAERLNGLFVCGALTDAADAEAWFDETLAGFGSRRREARDAIDAVTRELRELGALDTSARRRSDANVLRDSGEGHAERLRLVPTALGAAMDDARATLETMRAFRDADPAPATTRELLLFLCGLAEFGDVALRRNEKKLLREWNRARSSAGGTRFVRFPVMQEARARNANAKDVVATAIRAPREKLFVLAQVSMSDAREPNFADAPERARDAKPSGSRSARPPWPGRRSRRSPPRGIVPSPTGASPRVLPRRAPPRRSPRGGGRHPRRLCRSSCRAPSRPGSRTPGSCPLTTR